MSDLTRAEQSHIDELCRKYPTVKDEIYELGDRVAAMVFGSHFSEIESGPTHNRICFAVLHHAELRLTALITDDAGRKQKR
ncbi:MAG: hypothetical protein DMG11_26860 [Acidobacteria bacterium]|nr:MAG: hypothetical protein DMG11_26860 [Acidobacteriota bacterium]